MELLNLARVEELTVLEDKLISNISDTFRKEHNIKNNVKYDCLAIEGVYSWFHGSFTDTGLLSGFLFSFSINLLVWFVQ